MVFELDCVCQVVFRPNQYPVRINVKTCIFTAVLDLDLVKNENDLKYFMYVTLNSKVMVL